MATSWPKGTIPQRPRVSAGDLRHPRELVINLLTAALSLALLFALGYLLNLVGVLIVIGYLILVLLFFNLTNKGTMVQVSEHQFPQIHRLARQVADNLHMPVPSIFVMQSPELNAYATGIRQPRTVVLHSATVEQLTEEELAFVVAHEFGHIKCNHIAFMLLQNLTAGGLMGTILGYPLSLLTAASSRVVEYTGDRAGLIGTMNIKAAITALTKLAVGGKLFQEMNLVAYVQQITEFDSRTGHKFVEVLNSANHPFIANRINALIRLYRAPDYQRLAYMHGRAGTTTLTMGGQGTAELLYRVAQQAESQRQVTRVSPEGGRADPVASLSCGQCGSSIVPGARVCSRCGTSVAGVPTEQSGSRGCPNCGRAISEPGRFCSRCGHRVIP